MHVCVHYIHRERGCDYLMNRDTDMYKILTSEIAQNHNRPFSRVTTFPKIFFLAVAKIGLTL